MKSTDKEKLWDEYRQKPTQALREQLIIEYSQLVKLVAGRLSMYLGHNVEYDDLVSYGIFGLTNLILQRMLNLRHMLVFGFVGLFWIRFVRWIGYHVQYDNARKRWMTQLNKLKCVLERLQRTKNSQKNWD